MFEAKILKCSAKPPVIDSVGDNCYSNKAVHRAYRNAEAVAHRGDWNQTHRNIFMDVAVVESLRCID